MKKQKQIRFGILLIASGMLSLLLDVWGTAYVHHAYVHPGMTTQWIAGPSAASATLIGLVAVAVVIVGINAIATEFNLGFTRRDCA